MESTDKINFCSEIDFCSQYIYRGLVIKKNFVSQPGLTASYSGFGAGIWCNINSFESAKSPEISEFDLFFSHELPLGNFCFNSAFSVYLYTGTEHYPKTAEYSLNASYFTGPVGFYAELNVDIMEYSGAYIVNHGIYYERKISEDIYINSRLGISWSGTKYNKVNAGLEKTLFNYAGLDLSMTYFTKGGVYIKPHIQYNRILDSELQQYIDKHNLFYGILTGYTF